MLTLDSYINVNITELVLYIDIENYYLNPNFVTYTVIQV